MEWPGFLVVPRGKNREKYICAIIPEEDGMHSFKNPPTSCEILICASLPLALPLKIIGLKDTQNNFLYFFLSLAFNFSVCVTCDRFLLLIAHGACRQQNSSFCTLLSLFSIHGIDELIFPLPLDPFPCLTNSLHAIQEARRTHVSEYLSDDSRESWNFQKRCRKT